MNRKVVSSTSAAFVAACLLISASPAAAQGSGFSTQASALTSNHPGTSRAESGQRPGERVAFAASDPPEVRYGAGPHQQLSADTAAQTGTSQGQLHTEVSAEARPIEADYFPNNTVSGWTEARFTDTLLVVSDQLAANTPVTLVFRDNLAGWREASGIYEGYARCILKVGGETATTVWRLDPKHPVEQPESPTLTVETFVGARLVIAAQLDAEARAMFTDRVTASGGRLSLGAYCNTPLESSSQPVRLVSASGAEYDLAAR